nr:PREDICTED: uncharacterized protein LOC103986696 isoform X2 [Musa acuminata subsp. malaccensis]
MAITCCSLCGPLPSVLTKPLLPPRSLGGWSGSSVAAAPSGRLRKVPALLVRASVVDLSESSSRFAKRMERAWLISQPTPTSLSLAIKCYVKCLLEIPPVLYAWERVLLLALIAKAQASVQNGWRNLGPPLNRPLPSMFYDDL